MFYKPTYEKSRPFFRNLNYTVRKATSIDGRDHVSLRRDVRVRDIARKTRPRFPF